MDGVILDAMAREQTYGFFPGGSFDPRAFKPDTEACTPEEIDAWKAACAAWDRGERPVRFEVSGRHTGAGISCGSAYGVGTYEVEVGDDPGPGGGDLCVGGCGRVLGPGDDIHCDACGAIIDRVCA